ncbi:hypothetical protein [Methanospirillum hungatei]|uniref:hypothetical protein n=1 Tax=Methanospirillum hungatei TaxID=2203 RepID=UPI0026E9B782|nr:hypothetical protein [Methanospirillum hungatei]MCA1916051.1 hypothetical protein [Methanospirillum hungatei]
MDLVLPLGLENQKSIQMGLFQKKEHGTMTTKKRELKLIFRAPLSDDQSQETNIGQNQKKNESPNHENAAKLLTGGVLSIFPFGRQKSTLFQNIATLPTQQDPGQVRKPDRLVNGLHKSALNLMFESPTEIQDMVFESLYLTGSHQNQYTHQGRGMIHV